MGRAHVLLSLVIVTIWIGPGLVDAADYAETKFFNPFESPDKNNSSPYNAKYHSCSDSESSSTDNSSSSDTSSKSKFVS